METIKQGSRGETVKILQQRLFVLVDGIFGPLTEESVKEFQKLNNLTVDGIVGPKTWNKLGITPFSDFKKGNPRNIKRLIIHCSATPDGEDYTTEQIRQMHLKRSFSDIGYHYVIYRDGTICKGRDEKISGAHTAGYNSSSIGLCYIGGCAPRSEENWMRKGRDTRTMKQKESLLKLLRELKKKYPAATIHGHREFAAKACPCFDVALEYKGI